MEEEVSLFAAEVARRRAMVDNDVDALEAMIADSFHYAHGNGLVEDRDSFFARSRAGAVRTTESRATEMKAVFRAGYALLTGRSHLAWDGNDTGGTVDGLFTSVWERTKSGWTIVAYASTPAG